MHRGEAVGLLLIPQRLELPTGNRDGEEIELGSFRDKVGLIRQFDNSYNSS